MNCHSCREALSARMDGEAESVDPVSVDDHLSTCGDCGQWQRDASRLTRVIRVRPALPTPDLASAILAAADAGTAASTPSGKAAGSVARWAANGQTWRRLLGLVALIQVSVGLSELLGVSHMGMTMSSDSEHLFNESTAWNIAVGIGFAASAVWPRLAGGLLPTLGVFLAVLTGVSITDLVNGNADLTRVSSHLVVLAGLALLAVVHRGYARDPGTGQRSSTLVRTGPVLAEAMPDHRPGGETGRPPGLRPAGRHAA